MQRSFFIYDTTPTINELIDNGVRLWKEEAGARSKPGMNLNRLWTYALTLMDINHGRDVHEECKRKIDEEQGHSKIAKQFFEKEYAPPKASTYEMLIINNNLVPHYWKYDSFFPNRGLAISAFYFLESRNYLASEGHPSAWASLTMAYYYLGMNSSPRTAQESASEAARTKSANIGGRLRSLVVEVARSIPRDGSIKSASEAIDLVVEIIEKTREYKEILLEFDSKTPAETKTPKQPGAPNEPSDRLRNNLERWMATSSRYPEIVEAFAPFKRNMGKDQGKTRNR